MNPPKYAIALVGGKYRILRYREANGYYEPIAEGNSLSDAKTIVSALNGVPE